MSCGINSSQRKSLYINKLRTDVTSDEFFKKLFHFNLRLIISDLGCHGTGIYQIWLTQAHKTIRHPKYKLKTIINQSAKRYIRKT